MPTQGGLNRVYPHGAAVPMNEDDFYEQKQSDY